MARFEQHKFSRSPVISSVSQLPRAAVIQGVLQLDYSHDTSKTDITLTPQVSRDLAAWYIPGQAGAPAGFLDSALSTAGTTESRRATVPVTPGNPLYLPLRVTKN